MSVTRPPTPSVWFNASEVADYTDERFENLADALLHVARVQIGEAPGVDLHAPRDVTAGPICQFSGGKNDTEDVTNSDSTGRAKEFIVTLLDSGQLKCGGNYVGSDTGQQALRSAFLSGALTPFQLTLPKTAQQQNSGDTFAFSAVVEESNIDVQYDKAITWSGSLKISGIITFTAGS